MLSRSWRWGTSLALAVTARAFQTASYRHNIPAFLKASTTFRSTLSLSSALSVSTTADTADATITSTTAECNDNPLLRSWSDQPFNLPPFKEINPTHFEPALEAAMEDHISDLESIAKSESNSFDDILGAYDRAGSLYSKVGSVYGNFISSLNTEDMQAVQTAMSPILSRHRSKCYNIPGLFEKIESMNNVKDEKLKSGEWTAEQARLAERVYIGFVKNGAKLDEESKKEYADIAGEYLLVCISYHMHKFVCMI